MAKPENANSNPLSDTQNMRVDSQQSGLLHKEFESVVRARKNATCLNHNGNTLSYGELNVLANRIAHKLLEHGIKPDSLIAIYLDRSPELIVSILGILKAGAAYLPIDLAYPSERVDYMLNDSKPEALITHSELVANLPKEIFSIICVDEFFKSLSEKEAEKDPNVKVDPENLAYVIYTSGTTGSPKGTMITHRNVLRLFSQTEHWFSFCEQDVWTLFHSCAFDFSVWEIWGALLYGGRLVVVPYLISRSPEEFYRLLETEQITVLNQTPSAFKQLHTAIQSHPNRGLNLRYVIFGGEALNMKSLKPWFEQHGDHRPKLINMYGITETTVHVTYRPLSKKDVESPSVIGEPIPDLRLYVLDANSHEVEIGKSGELYVGGPGLARGYLNRPDLTKEKFVPDNLSGQSKARLYKTGDLVRLNDDGELEYLGRTDHQVKIRGFRIELGEIESHLIHHAKVRDAIVLAQESFQNDQHLIAYCICKAGEDFPTSSEFRSFLSSKLPDYMIPSIYIQIESLPLNTNGKVNINALPQPKTDRPNLSNPYIAPRNDLEKRIAGIWQDVLEIDQVGINDSFSDLGGSSLNLVKIHSLLESMLEREIPITELFAVSTVRTLAMRIEGNQNYDGAINAVTDRAAMQRKAHAAKRKRLR